MAVDNAVLEKFGNSCSTVTRWLLLGSAEQMAANNLVLEEWKKLQHCHPLVAAVADGGLVVQAVCRDQRCRQSGCPWRADHRGADGVRFRRALRVTVFVIPVPPQLEDDVLDLVADSQENEKSGDREHDPDRGHGSKVGVWLLHGEPQGHDDNQTVEAASLQSYSLHASIVLSADGSQSCARQEAVERQQHGAKESRAVDQLKDIHVDVHAQRDVEDAGQQQEGLDEPHEDAVGNCGSEALDRQPSRVGQEAGQEPDLQVVDGYQVRIEKGMRVCQKVLAQYEHPKRGRA